MPSKLFERRLIIVSGKGGVGKTSVSAALALLCARSGLKTLLCELEREGRLARLFNVKDAQSGDTKPLSAENLNYLFINTEAALEEYMSIYLRFKVVYGPIINSPAMGYFLRAAPGFKELLTIGKIWWEEQLLEGRPKKHRWDTIIVDAPATGHGISFMGVSKSTMDMVRVGPIKAQAQRMVEALTDAARTNLVIVTLPEEMPINESILLAEKSTKQLGIHLGPVIVNSMPVEVFPRRETEAFQKLLKEANEKKLSPSIRSMFKLAEYGIRRRELAEVYVDKLKKSLPEQPFVEIPFIPNWNWDRATVDQMANSLGEALGPRP